jgi:hypothetical protein
MSGRNLTAAEERHRCLRLVEAYRKRMEKIMDDCTTMPASTKLPINGAWVTAKDCHAFAEAARKSLLGIEAKIRDHKRPAVDTGDFTLQEIDAAMAIMEEQEPNPFE